MPQPPISGSSSTGLQTCASIEPILSNILIPKAYCAAAHPNRRSPERGAAYLHRLGLHTQILQVCDGPGSVGSRHSDVGQGCPSQATSFPLDIRFQRVLPTKNLPRLSDSS
jgi:hypothetical protein